MTGFVLLSIALVALAGAVLTRHAWWTGSGFAHRDASDEVRSLAAQMKQLQGLHASGVLDDSQFAQGQAAIERKLLDAVAPSERAGAPTTRPSPALAGAALAFVAAIAAVGYQVIGSPVHLALGPESSGTAPMAAAGDTDAAGNAGHPVTSQQIEAMVAGLAAKLKDKPDDPEGWLMLARSYVALGRHADAVGAFKRASAQRTDDADLFADYADALAVANNSGLEGEPLRLVERALKIDPRNVKALSLSGTAAFDKKDFAGAVAMWERAVQIEPPGTAFSQQLKSGIAEARQMAGMPPAKAQADAQPNFATSVPATGAAPGTAKVSGVVALAPNLAARVSPDDTVFVFARPVQGQRMPLAIVRKQVKDLPFKFTLDDSMSMSPEARLSGFTNVVVGARVSKSGNAMPQAGDLQGITASVAVGSSDVRIDINQEVTGQ